MNKKTKFSLSYFLSIFMVMVLVETIFFSGSTTKEIPYSTFITDVKSGKIENAFITQDKIYGNYLPEGQTTSTLKDEEAIQTEGKPAPWRFDYKKRKEELSRQFYVIKIEDPNLVTSLELGKVNFKGVIENNWLANFFANWILPFVIISIIWGVVMRRMSNSSKMGGQFLNVGQKKAKIYPADTQHLTHFKDVAGCDEAKQELAEVVDFLKNPEKYTNLGAKIPKGILLVGPPGTGKTLLAKAVAGEAGVLFYAMSGSDFVEMFVGVGAARVRDLFTEAKAKAPCIIFIDEIDAIGKARSSNGMGGNDERENTLNQLLVEMNGFEDDSAVIVLAATNRPETLDKALLRPGRFDRQVTVDRPDLEGRKMILNVHVKKIKLANDVDLREIAAQTAGFVGADLANLCNEAALFAARGNKQEVHHKDFLDAFERVIAGLEKKSTIINVNEKKVVAYHESGHAIVGYYTKGADPVRKISIVPRGSGALGYVLQAPSEQRFLMGQDELIGKIKGLLGGRAAEDLVFGEVSTGASNDLEKVSSIVKAMFVEYGMSQNAPNLSLKMPGQNSYLGATDNVYPMSEELRKSLDQEAKELVAQCYAETRQFLEEHREQLNKLAGILLDKEVLDEQDVVRILGKKE